MEPPMGPVFTGTGLRPIIGVCPSPRKSSRPLDNCRAEFRVILQQVGAFSERNQRYLIESRLVPLVHAERIATLNDLCSLLRANGASPLRQRVVEAMTTNETLFFRDPPAFAALHNSLLPELIARSQSARKLSIWSAAASTGQEAYSLAMLLLDMELSGWDIRILATDLNSQVVERARTGRYSQIEVNRGLPAKYLVKYFRRNGAEWEITENVRRTVEFRTFDLRQSLRSLGPFDLILCRNILIYFDVETKKTILGELRRTLSRGGYLLLGCAESTFNLDNEFIKRQVDQATFFQAP